MKNLMTIQSRIEKYWDERSEDFSRVRMIEFNGISAEIWREILTADLPFGELKILDVGTGA